MSAISDDKAWEAAKKKFPVGSKVQLNVGGPIMSVEEHEYHKRIKCQWFSGKKLEDGNFSPETLIIAPDAKEES